jgi:hypothetical protein
VAETFKQFAEAVRKERDRQVSNDMRKKIQPQALKLQQQGGYGQAQQQGSYNNFQGNRPQNPQMNPQQMRQNLYTGEQNQPRPVSQPPMNQAKPQNPFTLFIQEKRR